MLGVSLRVCLLLLAAASAIEDPLGIFCGSEDCYAVLGISRTEATPKVIKKAYRKTSLLYHPDKNKDDNATELFRLVSKAAEVLGDEEQKELYDYYLDHPSQYYKVSGVHFYKSIPKTDVRYIIAGVVILLSVLLPFLQHQRYEDAIRMVREGLTSNNGGSTASMRLHHICMDKYKEISSGDVGATGKSGKGGASKKQSQIVKDPVFTKIVRQTLAELKLEGAFRKPGISDVFLVKLLMLPYHMFCWMRNLSPSACLAALQAVVSSVRAALTPTVQAAPIEATDSSSKPKKAKISKNKVRVLAPRVDSPNLVDESDVDSDNEEVRESEKLRASLQKVLLSRVVGNSKKKLAGKHNSRQIPFSKAEVKFICCRLSVEHVREYLELATQSAGEADDVQKAHDDLCEALQARHVEFQEYDKQFPSSILEGDQVYTTPLDEATCDANAAVEEPTAALVENTVPVTAPREWRREDLSYLARALGKYPGGTRQRWVCISNAMNDWVKPDTLFSPDECAKGATSAMKQLAKGKDGNSDAGQNSQSTGSSLTPIVSASTPDSPTVGTNTTWTQSEQTALERGMAQYGSNMDPSERWARIAEEVPDKSSDECFARFKQLRSELRAKKKFDTGS